MEEYHPAWKVKTDPKVRDINRLRRFNRRCRLGVDRLCDGERRL